MGLSQEQCLGISATPLNPQCLISRRSCTSCLRALEVPYTSWGLRLPNWIQFPALALMRGRPSPMASRFTLTGQSQGRRVLGKSTRPMQHRLLAKAPSHLVRRCNAALPSFAVSKVWQSQLQFQPRTVLLNLVVPAVGAPRVSFLPAIFGLG